jgi:hypothetical protein
VDSTRHDAVSGHPDRRVADMTITVVRPGSVLSLSGRLCAATVADVRRALGTALEMGDGDLVVTLAAHSRPDNDSTLPGRTTVIVMSATRRSG